MKKPINLLTLLIATPLMHAAASDSDFANPSTLKAGTITLIGTNKEGKADEKGIQVPLAAALSYSDLLKGLHAFTIEASSQDGFEKADNKIDLSPFSISSDALQLLADLMQTAYTQERITSVTSSMRVAQATTLPALDTIIELINQSEILLLKPVILDAAAYLAVTGYPGSLTELAHLPPDGKSAIAKQLYLTMPEETIPEGWKQGQNDISFGVSVQDLIDHNKLQNRIAESRNRIDLSSMNINDLTGLNRIPGITSVLCIDLAGNQLHTLTRDAFKGLDRLERLQLDSNQIETIDADAFTYLANLDRISLYNNRLTSIKPKTFEPVSKLTYLSLRNNNLHRIAGSLFADLTDLEELSLGGNPILPDDKDRIVAEIKALLPHAIVKIYY